MPPICRSYDRNSNNMSVYKANWCITRVNTKFLIQNVDISRINMYQKSVWEYKFYRKQYQDSSIDAEYVNHEMGRHSSFRYSMFDGLTTSIT